MEFGGAPGPGAYAQALAGAKLCARDLGARFRRAHRRTACGEVIFKRHDDLHAQGVRRRLTALTSSTLGIGMLVCGVYLIAAMAQLCVGWWLDRRSPQVGVRAGGRPAGAAAPARGDHGQLLHARPAVSMMFFVFGQIPINDAMIARYAAEEWRARAYAVRYVVSSARARSPCRSSPGSTRQAATSGAVLPAGDDRLPYVRRGAAVPVRAGKDRAKEAAA